MYTVDYFIQKFEAIPENLWIEGFVDMAGAHCALGHCGGYVEHSVESTALANILIPYWDSIGGWRPDRLNEIVYYINDGLIRGNEKKSPKWRILAALYDIKKMQGGEDKVEYLDITKELAILPTEETPDSVTIKILQP